MKNFVALVSLIGLWLHSPIAEASGHHLVRIVDPPDLGPPVTSGALDIEWEASEYAGECPTSAWLYVDGVVTGPAGSGCSGAFAVTGLPACIYTFHVEASYPAPGPSAVMSRVVQVSVEPGSVPPDADDDGVPNDCDNCVVTANVYQANCDGDTHGDTCDNCQLYVNDGQGDADLDGIGDTCEFAWGDVAPVGAPNGLVDVADAIRVLRFATGLETPTAAELKAANVAPAVLVEQPSVTVATPTPCPPPHVVDIADAVIVLRASVFLVQFTNPY